MKTRTAETMPIGPSNGLPLPGTDLDSMIAAQQRAMATVSKTAEIFVATTQSVVAKQAEIASARAERMTQGAQSLAKLKRPEDLLQWQVETGQAMIEAGVKDFHDFADIALRWSHQVADILRRSIDDAAQPPAASAAPPATAANGAKEFPKSVPA